MAQQDTPKKAMRIISNSATSYGAFRQLDLLSEDTVFVKNAEDDLEIVNINETKEADTTATNGKG